MHVKEEKAIRKGREERERDKKKIKKRQM